MKPITRRDFVSLTGAGIVVSALPHELQAQENLPIVPKSAEGKNEALHPDLTHLSTKVADATEDFAEDYFWIDDHTLLFLHLTPRKEGVFRAVLVDIRTGQKTLPQPFNDKNSPLLLGAHFGFGTTGSHHWTYNYAPPKVSLSPDRQWLLWPTETGNPELQWVAATLGGKQQLWKQVADPKSEMKFVGNNGYWLRDSTGWVELVRKYAKKKYTLPHVNIYELGNPAPVRTIEIEGLNDGLSVGLTQEGRVMMYHPPRNYAPITNAVFSLVSLEGEAVKAERLSVLIPKSTFVWQVTLSPDGDRLVWVLDEARGDSSENVIYMSTLDGKDFRAIGTAPRVEIGSTGSSAPDKVRWLPGSARLSFMYNKGIYVVPM